ncbi:MAG TPA: WD40 repeat domain-containing protein [Oscillatoriaceae cyanobacterium M33_DOE_052]|uniref:WD40 repeat domain-containing protein n=1 Tax=Planktothricoides sp. SpSt-374 TaxID=2282167 RepID=A0A7C3VFT3_9CYAN|nr:WD40 repeat domain-containing protein [Oscillatoriaceae cyanobacterium M33_DOE_052]
MQQPRPDDVVLGGQQPPPFNGVVLGGIEGARKRARYSSIPGQIVALQDALNYGPAGLDLIIEALQSPHHQIRWAAYSLLVNQPDPEIQQALTEHHPYKYIICLATLHGHTSAVRGVAISPPQGRWGDGETGRLGDGETWRRGDLETGRRQEGASESTIASASYDGTIKIWDLQTHRLLHTLQGHRDRVYSVAYRTTTDSDNAVLVSGSADNTIKIWHIPSGTCRQTLTGHTQNVCSVAVSPDGQTIASGSWDTSIRIWDITSGKCRQTLTGHFSWVYSIAFNPDGTQLASASADGAVRIWDLTTTRLRHILPSDGSILHGIAYNGPELPHGHTGQALLATCTNEGKINIWDASTGARVCTLIGHTKRLNSATFSPDGRTLISGSWDRTVKIWDPKRGITLRTLVGHTRKVNAVAISPDGQFIVSGSHDGTVKIWGILDC